MLTLDMALEPERIGFHKMCIQCYKTFHMVLTFDLGFCPESFVVIWQLLLIQVLFLVHVTPDILSK